MNIDAIFSFVKEWSLLLVPLVFFSAFICFRFVNNFFIGSKKQKQSSGHDSINIQAGRDINIEQ